MENPSGASAAKRQRGEKRKDKGKKQKKVRQVLKLRMKIEN